MKRLGVRYLVVLAVFVTAACASTDFETTVDEPISQRKTVAFKGDSDSGWRASHDKYSFFAKGKSMHLSSLKPMAGSMHKSCSFSLPFEAKDLSYRPLFQLNDHLYLFTATTGNFMNSLNHEVHIYKSVIVDTNKCTAKNEFAHHGWAIKGEHLTFTPYCRCFAEKKDWQQCSCENNKFYKIEDGKDLVL